MFLAASRTRTRTDARAVPAPQRAGPPRELREALQDAAVITLTDGEQHGDVLPDPQALLRRADACTNGPWARHGTTMPVLGRRPAPTALLTGP